MIHDWTIQSRKLIKAIKQFPKESKIILILRHSQRRESNNKKEIPKLGLTYQASEMAKEFGEGLPKYRPIKLFHSKLERCRVTAELILKGFKCGSGAGILKGPLRPLYGPGASLDFHSNESIKYYGEQFIFRWAAGLYSEDLIIPFISYCRNTAGIIHKQMSNAPQRCIDIYVTHDIFLMSLRFGWFGFPPNEKWVPFLGGIAFTLKEDCILLFDIDELIYADIPFWWKIKNDDKEK